MNSLATSAFVHRVITSRERIQFTHVDPYGHLNTARYCELIVNHRVSAVEDQSGISVSELMKTQGVAFVIARLDVRFHAPAYLGEWLEIASWSESVQKSGFEVRVVISGVENKSVRASALVTVRTVNVQSGRPVACPETLPTVAGPDVLEARPRSADYLGELKGVPTFT